MTAIELMLDARFAESQKDAVRVQRHVQALQHWNNERKQRAWAMTEKWQRESLCSPIYIETWQSLLQLSGDQIQARVTAEDELAVVLRRNSPILLTMEPM